MEDVSRLCCHNQFCIAYGARRAGNISVCGHTNKAKTNRQLYCCLCRSRCSETKGTVFYRSKMARDRIISILDHVKEGNGNVTAFLSITHYLTLHSDGTVGFQKTEGGLTQRQVSEQTANFVHHRETQGDAAKSYGKWEADGDTITIQWKGAFGNRTMRGRVDPRTEKLVLAGIGILKAGESVELERK